MSKLLKSYRIQPIKTIAKPHKRVKGYWKRYHHATGDDAQELEICRNVCEELGLPWQTHTRGRPPKMESVEYAALHLYRRHKGHSYRDMERASVLLLGFFVDHSWVGKTLQRIPPFYMAKAVQVLHGRIKALLVKHGSSVHITDSTGVTTDRKTISKKGKVYTGFVKLHIIIEYWPSIGILVIQICTITDNTGADSPTFRSLITTVHGTGPFFGDTAYGCATNRKLVRQHGFEPQLKPKKEIDRRNKKRVGFDEDAYKWTRARIESVFGGTTTQHDNRTRCRLWITRQNDSLGLAFSHNLQTYKQVICIKITLIRRQPRLKH